VPVDLPLVGIPIKPFGVAKQRLDSRLTSSQRSALGKAVAAHTIATAQAAPCEVVIVTGDKGVAEWAGALGANAIDEGPPGTGLNGAAAALRDAALATSRRWLVLHADLPSITPADVVALVGVLLGGTVISPSYDGGTTALGSSLHTDFEYGPSSFHRHFRSLPAATIVARPGLAFDLDTVADLDKAAEANAWIRAALDSPT